MSESIQNSESKFVELSPSRYEQLLRSEAHLEQLEIRGVDNWSGYVGSMFYCHECDNESEWHNMEDYDRCPECGAVDNSW